MQFVTKVKPQVVDKLFKTEQVFTLSCRLEISDNELYLLSKYRCLFEPIMAHPVQEKTEITPQKMLDGVFIQSTDIRDIISAQDQLSSCKEWFQERLLRLMEFEREQRDNWTIEPLESIEETEKFEQKKSKFKPIDPQDLEEITRDR